MTQDIDFSEPDTDELKLQACEYSTGKSRWLQVTAKSRIDRPYGRLSPHPNPLPKLGEGVKKLLPPKGVGF